jgi:hypothetical protein
MSDQKQQTSGVQTAAMPKLPANTTRVSLAELIKRTNQTPVRITA